MANPFKRLISSILPEKRAFIPYNISLHFSAFNDLLRQGKTEDATAFYLKLAPAEQSLLIEAVSEVVQEDTFFDEWHDEGNGPALAGLLRGTLLTKRAWHYRGRARSEDVSEEAWEKMGSALDTAIDTFKPLFHDPIYGREASARCIRAAKGQDYDWDQIDFLHKNIRREGGHSLIGELDYLVASCEKWLGSHQKMFDHAFDTVGHYPLASEVGCLIAAAHWERLMFLERFDKDKKAAKAYASNPKTLKEITNASARILRNADAGDQRFMIAHNIFAGVLSDFARFDLAKPHFTLMKQQVLPYPWRHGGPFTLQVSHTIAMRP